VYDYSNDLMYKPFAARLSQDKDLRRRQIRAITLFWVFAGTSMLFGFIAGYAVVSNVHPLSAWVGLPGSGFAASWLGAGLAIRRLNAIDPSTARLAWSKLSAGPWLSGNARARRRKKLALGLLLLSFVATLGDLILVVWSASDGQPSGLDIAVLCVGLLTIISSLAGFAIWPRGSRNGE
jgi:hypothetical protein